VHGNDASPADRASLPGGRRGRRAPLPVDARPGLGARHRGRWLIRLQPGPVDPLLEEARELSDHARDCGADARFELFAVDTHDFHIFWSFLPEAAQALQQAGRFARETTLAAQAGW